MVPKKVVLRLLALGLVTGWPKVIGTLADDRYESIWSIPRGFRTIYFLSFSAIFGYFVLVMGYLRWPVPHHRLSDLALSSAAISLVILHIVSLLGVVFMVLFGSYLTRKAQELKEQLEGDIPLAPEEQQEIKAPSRDERQETEADEDDSSNVD